MHGIDYYACGQHIFRQCRCLTGCEQRVITLKECPHCGKIAEPDNVLFVNNCNCTVVKVDSVYAMQTGTHHHATCPMFRCACPVGYTTAAGFYKHHSLACSASKQFPEPTPPQTEAPTPAGPMPPSAPPDLSPEETIDGLLAAIEDKWRALRKSDSYEMVDVTFHLRALERILMTRAVMRTVASKPPPTPSTSDTVKIQRGGLLCLVMFSVTEGEFRRCQREWGHHGDHRCSRY